VKFAARLKASDQILLGLLTVGLGLVALILWSIVGVRALAALVVLLVPLLMAAQIALYRSILEQLRLEISLAQGSAEAAQAAAYQQIEALFSIFSTLRVAAPLPPMRGWAISPDFAKIIAGTIYEKRPRRVLELGSGVSTLIAAYALRQVGGCALISLEHDQQFARTSDNNVKTHGLADLATVVYAPLREVVAGGRTHLWYDIAALAGLQEIDIVIVDGPPGTVQNFARYPALPLLWSRLSDEAVLLIDDADRADERKVIELWCGEFPSLVVERPTTEKGAVILRRNKEGTTSILPQS
jgi:predicted O-methyltransferase YrrM